MTLYIVTIPLSLKTNTKCWFSFSICDWTNVFTYCNHCMLIGFFLIALRSTNVGNIILLVCGLSVTYPWIFQLSLPTIFPLLFTLHQTNQIVQMANYAVQKLLHFTIHKCVGIHWNGNMYRARNIILLLLKCHFALQIIFYTVNSTIQRTIQKHKQTAN